LSIIKVDHIKITFIMDDQGKSGIKSE